MATTPEGKIKQQVKKWLGEIGAWYYMPVQNGMGRVGIPDFICCLRGKFFAIETKAPGKRGALTPNQKKNLDEIITAGGVALVVDDPAQLAGMVEQIIGGPHA